MRNAPRLDVWIVGLVVTVCLVGGAVLVLRFNIGGLRSVPAVESAAINDSGPTPLPYRARRRARVSHHESSKEATAPKHETSLRDAESSDKPKFESDAAGEGSRCQPNGSPNMEGETLKPLGYVQKADGRIEAIIADGDGVQVVHVGDTYQGRYTVARITPESVQIIGRAGPASGSDAALAASTLTPTKSVGYAERLDGTRIDVVAENGMVSLKQAGKTQPATLASLESPRPIGTSQKLNPAVPGSKQVASNRNPVNVIADKNNQLLRPAGTQKDEFPFKDLHKDSAATTTTSDPKLNRRTANQPVIPSGTIGFVEKSDGKVQAFIDEGDGVRLTSVPKERVAAIVANAEFLDMNPMRELGLSAPEKAQSDKIASPSPGSTPTPWVTSSGSLPPELAEHRPTSLMLPQAVSTSDELRPSGQSYNPDPQNGLAIVAENVIPEKPPPDEATITASFGEGTDAGESAKRDDTVLESLGLVNLQDGRASPETAPFEPAAPAKGPPETEAGVPSSFGYGDWPYGRASPLPADLGQREGSAGSNTRQLTVLKSIGYIEWQDGRTFAVIDDGTGGVRHVAAGETLDGRYRVVRVRPNEIELEELPAKPISLAAPALREPEGKPKSSPGKVDAASRPLALRDSSVGQPDSVIGRSRPFVDGGYAHVGRQHERHAGRYYEFFTRSSGNAGNLPSRCHFRKPPPLVSKLFGVLQKFGPNLRPTNWHIETNVIFSRSLIPQLQPFKSSPLPNRLLAGEVRWLFGNSQLPVPSPQPLATSP